MDRSTSLVVLEYALNAAWLLVPLIPATLIYLLFPSTRVAAIGPFQGFRLKLTGAFGAYFILLLLTWPLLQEQNAVIKSLFRPIWTVTGKLRVFDESGNAMPINEHTATVTLDNPNPIIIHRDGSFIMRVPEVEGQIPEIHITYGDFGEVTVPAVEYKGSSRVPESDSANVKINSKDKEINIEGQTLDIRKFCIGLCGAEASSH